MAARKFGVFGGVFTPAILTILGVIMYLRLPWIVGNAGMWATIGIVLVAHTISVTTGLSVSSMATDKRVKAGGSYYILSRSLGLPIGGTLGLALFVGLSFSVSLYVIGFSESFLGFVELPVTPMNIRICGSIVLFLVTGVTFISTALAIKTQFFIMAAIAVSLGSVLVGSDLPPPETPHLQPLPDGVSLVVLFGIFFPAVTGFEAGVSMSGDLKDPRRDIPGGTLAAIAVGLVAYVGLAVFFSHRIPAEELANNPRVLLDYAWAEELVLPGIWGATISSALGSILGAPRILQACAADRVGPRVFARGFGPDNEPRVALVMTFFIAWSGILIGELDLIARVVTMFFLTSYGFLNLACAIESAVSPDFRPDFRIPRVVPLLGAVVSLALMTQLDMLGMLGASSIMLLLFLVLRRRTLQLEGGDSWAGVWTSLVEWGLEKLRNAPTHERNWRPALVAFSGASGRALATELAGKTVTVFDDSQGFQQRVGQRLGSWQERAAACRYHGLPGLEPNTVLVEADDVLADPAGYLDFFEQVVEGGYSVLLLRDAGLGPQGGRIDAWTRGGGRSLSLQLSVIRLLLATPRWSRARVRFVAEVADVAERRLVEHRLAGWLKSMRVQAEVKVLVAGDSPMEQLALHSAEADLTLIGMPLDDDPASLAERLQALLARVGTALFVHASTSFSDPLTGFEPTRIEGVGGPQLPADTGVDLPRDVALATTVTRFHGELRTVLAAWADDANRALQVPLVADVTALDQQLDRALRQLVRARSLDDRRWRRLSRRVQTTMLAAVIEALDAITERSPAPLAWLQAGLPALDDGLATCVLGLDEVVDVCLPRSADEAPRAADPTDGALTRLLRHRRVRLRAGMIRALAARMPAEVEASLERGVSGRLRALLELDGWLVWTLEAASSLGKEDDVDALLDGYALRRDAWLEARDDGLQRELRAQAALAAGLAQDVADRLLRPRPSLTRTGTPGGFVGPDQLSERHADTLQQLTLLIARSRLEAWLRRARLVLDDGIEEGLAQVEDRVDQGLRAAMEATSRALEVARDAGERPSLPERPARAFTASDLLRALAEAIDAAVRTLPTSMLLADGASLDALERGELADVNQREVAVARLVGFLMERALLDGLREPAEELDRATRRAEDALAEAGRLLAAPMLAGDDVAFEGERVELLGSAQARIAREQAQLDQAVEALQSRVAAAMATLDEQLEGTGVVERAQDLGRFMRTQERARMLSRAGRAGVRARDEVVSVGIDLSYRLSSGVQAVRSRAEANEVLPVQAALAFRRSVAPPPEVLSAVPLAYRRAFVSRTGGDVLRWADHAEVDRVVADFVASSDEGRHGAMVVTGRPGAGTSALLDRIVDEQLGRRLVVQIPPPGVATGSPDALRHALCLAVGAAPETPAERLLASLPHGAAVVVRDLDRWWLRHPSGLGAIDQVCEWIERFGESRLFLLSCGSSSLDLLRAVTALPGALMASVEPPALDVHALQEVVMARHESTGLALWLDQRGQVPTEWQRARLFLALFEHAHGQVGPGLSGWLAQVVDAGSDGVVVRRAGTVDLDALAALPAEWVGALAALALHRRLDDEGLALAGGAAPGLSRTLVRAGLAERLPDAVVLDRFTGPHVVRWLRSEGVIG